jgi:HEAT repeat protein
VNNDRTDDILRKLGGGDRRSTGRVDEVVADVLAKPALFEALFDGMSVRDPIVRMRAADAVEKITAKHADWLKPYKQRLLGPVAAIEQQEVRWHVAQLLPRLPLTAEERPRAVNILLGYLGDKSAIVRTFSLQALADFAQRDETLRPPVVDLLQQALSSGSPAVRTRARKLLRQLRRD